MGVGCGVCYVFIVSNCGADIARSCYRVGRESMCGDTIMEARVGEGE